ncbi:MAG: prepilin-type N-terminal cleavage/methylation domain-containing protein [Planctomycetota bacterium]
MLRHLMARSGRTRNAFTLLELLLAMAVFAVMAAVVLPAAGSLLADRRLTRAADQLRAEMIRTRVSAMRQGRVMVLKTDQGTGKISIEPIFSASDATETLDQTGAQTSLLAGADQAIATLNTGVETAPGRIIELPDEVFVDAIATSPVGGRNSVEAASLIQPSDVAVTMQSSQAAAVQSNDQSFQPSSPLAPIYFYPNGSTSNAIITLSHEQAGTASLRLRGLTGDATIESS